MIPHLGTGHLANKNIQPIELFQQGDRDWQTRELPAATLQISDLRQFAAVVNERSPGFQPRARPGGAGNAVARQRHGLTRETILDPL